MREGLRALTRRGRLLLVAAVVAFVCAWLFGQRTLLSVGLLLLVLPLLSAFLVGRARYRLACARGLTPARLPVGDTATAVVRLDNLSRLPSGVLMVEDDLPWELGSPPRFVLDRMESGGSREVTYRLTSPVRGRWTVGPVAVRIVDPFGLCTVARSFAATDTLVVTPAVHPLGVQAVGGAWTGSGESRSAAISSSGEDDVVPREYRTGDDLRRVHWGATARAGELMVRREEQPWRSRSTVLVDLRERAHAGLGAGSSLETAMSVAASVGVHLLRRGFEVAVVDADGEPLVSDSPTGDAEGVLLDALAVAEATTATSVAAHAATVRRQVGDGLLVAIVGGLDLADAERLAGLRQGTATGLAVLLDTDRWSLPPGAPGQADGPGRTGASPRATAAAALLRAAGWRVAVAGPGDTVAGLWSSLGRGGDATGGTSDPGPRVPEGVGGPR